MQQPYDLPGVRFPIRVQGRGSGSLKEVVGVTHFVRLLVLLEPEGAVVGMLAFAFSTSNEQIQ